MKRVLIAALLPLLFFACAKEDETNPAFREPSCADTTDDGHFEKYTLPEQVQFLKYFKWVADTEWHGYIRYNYINGHVLYNRNLDYNPILVYRPENGHKVKFFGYIPLKTQQEQYYSWVNESSDSSRNDTINIYQLRELNPQLQPGCYRLYYIFAEADSTIVYSKGHYDFEIKN